MTSPRLLLVSSFTELEWGIREDLEDWAEVASFDMPGVGAEPLPNGFEIDPSRSAELLSRWRDAAADRGVTELDGRGWDRALLITDGHGMQAGVRLARKRPDAIVGIAIGHASLSHSTTGARPAMNAGPWDALAQLADQGSEPFVRYGIAQMTRGGYSEELAEQMLERLPDMELVSLVIRAIGEQAEPIGEDLRALALPLLLAKHEGCLGRTDEGFEDIVAAFPEAKTAICPEACTSSPVFAAAIRRFATDLAGSEPRRRVSANRARNRRRGGR